MHAEPLAKSHVGGAPRSHLPRFLPLLSRQALVPYGKAMLMEQADECRTGNAVLLRQLDWRSTVAVCRYQGFDSLGW